MNAGIERRAREILAAEFDNVRDHDYAASIRDGRACTDTGPVIRAIAAALQAQQPPEHADLRAFYSVQTDAELIAAQARHIERLQAKLPSNGQPAFTRVREG
jgi:hypothetical protein